MNIDLACVECIVNQAARVGDTLRVDTNTKQKLIEQARKMSASFDFSKTPPEVATPVYRELAAIVSKKDLYDTIKRKATQKALAYVPALEAKLKASEDPFLTALKIAVAGNVIDLAAEVSFDLEEELEKVFHTDFAIDDTRRLYEALKQASNVAVIADNAGEHVFDKLCIEALQKIFPNVRFSYVVRGAPIINDVTYEEALAIGFDTVCEVIDSGVDTPGFVYERATKEAQRLFDRADAVIAKGMGNYECLSPAPRSCLYYLLKIKCNVVASSLGGELGAIVCKTTK